ncbi:alpha/beta fold hydrolase [Enterobacter sp. CC120223-11]|uniref:alpha/beta hydrolase n=1 Tax=Enterobacter sp. CC120223-11 TaxID=1378073 RepID=UPI000BC49359|nr:alpha/beta hydrolase [Enterobacter sp. CC120223-11]SNY70298.1 Acetyl esterase/lipase [Enterobacter sp. CC120223-11]
MNKVTGSLRKSLLACLLLAPMGGAFAAETGLVVSKSDLAQAAGLQEAASQYRVEYRSLDGVKGKGMRVDSAAVFLPEGPVPEGGWPVVVWTHGTVGIAHDCAPSLNARTPRDSQYLNTWLSLGYAVVAPDYPGLGSAGLHHYLDARAEAWSTLDSIRAALATFPLKNQLVLVGQSQGAHAAFATAGYQPDYAPELNIIGTVLTGTPYFTAKSQVSGLFTTTAEKQLATGDPKIPYVFYIYHSAADRDPNLKAADYFQKAALGPLEEAKSQCITPLTELVMKDKLTMENSLKPGIQDLLNASVSSLSYPTLHIKHPVFIGIGGDDINVPTAMQQQFAHDVQAAGTQVSQHLYPGLDHSGAVNPSLRDSVPFVLGLKAKQ